MQWVKLLGISGLLATLLFLTSAGPYTMGAGARVSQPPPIFACIDAEQKVETASSVELAEAFIDCLEELLAVGQFLVDEAVRQDPTTLSALGKAYRKASQAELEDLRNLKSEEKDQLGAAIRESLILVELSALQPYIAHGGDAKLALLTVKRELKDLFGRVMVGPFGLSAPGLKESTMNSILEILFGL
jgi:hypothetical protein